VSTEINNLVNLLMIKKDHECVFNNLKIIVKDYVTTIDFQNTTWISRESKITKKQATELAKMILKATKGK
jgi:6-pyruvoyl-tetrahydropterin synthase